MKKKLIIAGLALLCCIGLAALVYSIHNFIIPNSFGDLSSFADKSVLAWAEAPALTKAYDALKNDPIGKTLCEGTLFRDFIAAPLSDRVRFFARRLESVTGLDIGEAVLARAFELPAAIALYEIDKSNTAPACILRVRPGDSLIASLAAKLIAALGPDNTDGDGSGLTKTQWKDESIYSLKSETGNEKQTLHFALVNDVLIVSPDMDLVKLSIRNASLGETRSLPPDWKDFLTRHPLREGTLARVWMHQDFLLSAYPGAALLVPELARVPSLSLALVTKPGLALEASWNAPGKLNQGTLLNESMIRQLPAAGLVMEANANFTAGESWLKSKLFANTMKEIPKAIRANLENFFKTLTGGFAIVFDGFDGTGKSAWPEVRLIFDVREAKASAEAFARLESLITSIPGVRTVTARHHNVEYRLLLERGQHAPSRESFNPCFARIGEQNELIILTLDENSMKSAIELSRGVQAQFLDTALFGESLGKVRRENLMHYAFLDAKKILANTYTQMQAFGFRSEEYSQRDLAAAFRPLLNNGPGFTTLIAVAAREENYIRATLTPR